MTAQIAFNPNIDKFFSKKDIPGIYAAQFLTQGFWAPVPIHEKEETSQELLIEVLQKVFSKDPFVVNNQLIELSNAVDQTFMNIRSEVTRIANQDLFLQTGSAAFLTSRKKLWDVLDMPTEANKFAFMIINACRLDTSIEGVIGVEPLKFYFDPFLSHEQNLLRCIGLLQGFYSFMFEKAFETFNRACHEQ